MGGRPEPHHVGSELHRVTVTISCTMREGYTNTHWAQVRLMRSVTYLGVGVNEN